MKDPVIESKVSELKETVEKVQVLQQFGFGSREPVDVKGQDVAPYDLMVAMMGTGNRAIVSRLRAMASDCPRSSAPTPG